MTLDLITDLSDDDVTAAELAFGLLDEPDAATARDRLAAEPGFALAHDRWIARALAMTDTDIAPRPSLWNEIVLQMPNRRHARGATRWWRAGTVTGFAAAAAAIVFAVSRPVPSPVLVPVAAPMQPPLVAVLTGKDGGVLTVSYERASSRLTVVPTGIAMPGKATELWVIVGKNAPSSLGVIGSRAPSWRIAPVNAQAMIAGATLAVSVEPEGGSPTGRPTGPVILTGTVTPV